MWPFDKKSRQEERAQEAESTVNSDFIALLIGNSGVTATREIAMQLPTISGGIDLISNLIAGTPIKLYRERDNETEEVKDDLRVRLVNDETGDTLDANQFWRALISDYYLGGGGYAYINRRGNEFLSLHYVEQSEIFIAKADDPIYKDYDIVVRGSRYKPYEFFKVLRNSRDGATGLSIVKESSKLIETAYESLIFEGYLAKNGGNKRGFLESEHKIDKDTLEQLKESFNQRYNNQKENVIVLNSGVKFKEASSTSAELQMNENKAANAEEFAKIFHISTAVMSGRAGENDVAAMARLAAIPLMKAIECALNRDLLLESEKGSLYWAFDTKELLKGGMKERFEAYKAALDANFMQIDEVRYAEDLPPLGLTWIKLGLEDVLYDPDTKEIFTPNTGKSGSMSGENTLLDDGSGDIIEPRANPNHGADGRFAPGGKTKYAPSKRRSSKGITVNPKKYAKLTGVLGTQYPGLKAGEKVTIRDAKCRYDVTADGHGGMIINRRIKL